MVKNRDAQNKLAEAMTKHAAWLHRAATAQVNDSIELINKESLKLSRILADELDSLTATELKLLGQGKYSTKRLKSVKSAIDGWSNDFGQKFSQMTLEGFEQLGGYEAEYTRRSLAAATGSKTLAAAPSAAATLAAAKARPILGEMMADLVKGLAEKNKQVVYNTLRQGINQGMTTPEITRAIVGTKALKRKDGTMQQARVAAARIVRTGRNHVSNVAYEETYQALGVKELIWVSTLDGRTCFVKGTKVDTPDGKKDIDKLARGDYVIGGSGEKREVLNTMKYKTETLCRITLSNGEVIVCTTDHRFWNGKKWVNAEDLEVGCDLPSVI